MNQVIARTYTALVLHRRMINVVGDCGLWGLSMFAAIQLRFDFEVPDAFVHGVLVLLPIALLAQFAIGLLDGLYVGRWNLGSFEEVSALARTVAVTAAVLIIVDLPIRLVPLSVAITAPMLALAAMMGGRYVWRLQNERRRRPRNAGQSLLVYGAGDAGVQIITSLLRDPSAKFHPVGLIDDDPRKQNLRIRGIPVVGTRSELHDVVERTRATALLAAIPSASAAFVRDLSGFCLSHDLDFRVLPSTNELFGGKVGTADIRHVTEADLLGRREITTDLLSIAHYLHGKRVLVTGAGGSIGSELCRQVRSLGPARLYMLDRDESALHAVQLSIEGRALLDSDELVLADLRDDERMRDVFETCRPEVVFHAAALKHLTLLERHPAEGLKTNVEGTQRMLNLSVDYGVERFVNISTDKAADPSSVLGSTKRIAERLTAQAAQSADGVFLSVRFGNVLGSRGSVLPLFRTQIDAGGPVTVTHPDVTRYFMTIEEAVQLVIQAGAIGGAGEVLVLDMGEPVQIAQVAKELISHARVAIKIEYTGLRPGEKLHEVLLAPDERVTRRIHPLISHVDVPPVAPNAFAHLNAPLSKTDLIDKLGQVANADAKRFQGEPAASFSGTD